MSLPNPFHPRQTWEIEVYDAAGCCFLRRDLDEVKPEYRPAQIGEMLPGPDGTTILRVDGNIATAVRQR